MVVVLVVVCYPCCMAGLSQRKTGKYAGQWVGTIYLPDGKRKYICGATRKAVQAKLALFEATGSTKETKTLQKPQASTTLKDYSVKWLELQTRQVSPTTVRWRKKHFEHIVRALGDYSLTEITTADVGRFLASLDFHPTTVTHIRSTLSVLFAEAVRDRLISYNPVKGSYKPRQRDKAEVSIIQDADFNLLYTYFEHSNHRLKRACQFLMLTGMRVGELIALSPSDLRPSYSGFEVHINKAWTFASNGKHTVGSTKTVKSRRRLLLTDEMKRIIDCQLEEIVAPLFETSDYDFVPLFPNEKGTYLNHKTLWDFWSASLQACGMEHVGIHSTRHTVITRLLREGVPLHDICAWTGHSSPTQILNTYGHTTAQTNDHLQAAFQAHEPKVLDATQEFWQKLDTFFHNHVDTKKD